MLQPVKQYFQNLQNEICAAIEDVDGSAKFLIDNWQSDSVVEASSRIISAGNVFEHGAVNFSYMRGNKLPQAASVRYPEIAGAEFEVVGISLIMHPQNPYVPTTHANLRFFCANNVWWFGGGYDLTPYYPFIQDCVHWHNVAAAACAEFGENIYAEFKDWCDRYFYLPHRNETRGIGGLFFDDLNRWDYDTCFNFVKSIGDSFTASYIPIVNRRKDTPFGERERDFQLYRRGRYVEFNLLHDRGTLFGIQSKGRTESILASLPPLVKWRYNWQPEPNTPEAELYANYLRPRDWITQMLIQS